MMAAVQFSSAAGDQILVVTPPQWRTDNLALMPRVSAACVSLNAFAQHRPDGSLNTEPRPEDENQTLLNPTGCL